MAEKRSLDAALSMTPEKHQFIKNDRNDVSDSSEQSMPATTEESVPSAADRPSLSPSKFRHGDAALHHQRPTYAPTLVSVTTRLHQDTAEALRRAYLEQKLNRQFPNTQQEIIEEALQHWLYERGFLS